MKYRKWINTNKLNIVFLFSILVLIIVSRLIMIFVLPLWHPSEGRYAEIARNMVETGNWITPQLEIGVPFWGKPPLLFWMSAFCIPLFGVNEFSVRLPSFLFSIGCLYLVYLLGTSLKNRIFGLNSTIILASSSLFFLMSGMVLLDPVLSATITLTMTSFAMSFREQSRVTQTIWGYIVFVGLGLSVLAKGLIGLVLILFPILLWIFLFKKWKVLFKTIPWCLGPILFILIAVPWHLMAESLTPGFLNYYIIGEHFNRFLISGWSGDLYGYAHRYPVGVFLLFVILDTLPWNILCLSALIRLFWNNEKLHSYFQNEWHVYIFLWFLVPIMFFTFSKNIVYTYALPSLPPFAILTALALNRALSTLNSKPHLHGLPDSPIHPVWILSRPVFLCSALLVPILMLASLFFINPLFINPFSQKELIIKFNQFSNFTKSNLFYVGKYGYTTSFYSLGKSVSIDDDKMDTIHQYITDEKLDYYICNSKNKNHELIAKTEVIYRTGDFVLRRDNGKQLVSVMK